MSVSLFVSRIFAIPQPKLASRTNNPPPPPAATTRKCNDLSNIIIIIYHQQALRVSPEISIKKGISNAPLNQNENNLWLIFLLVHTMHPATSSNLELPDVCRTQFAVVPDHVWQRDSPNVLTTWSVLQYLISDNKKRLLLGNRIPCWCAWMAVNCETSPTIFSGS